VPRLAANSDCTVGSATTTDHIPTLPSEPISTATASRIHARRETGMNSFESGDNREEISTAAAISVPGASRSSVMPRYRACGSSATARVLAWPSSLRRWRKLLRGSNATRHSSEFTSAFNSTADIAGLAAGSTRSRLTQLRPPAFRIFAAQRINRHRAKLYDRKTHDKSIGVVKGPLTRW
jgi:hypothetical protein